MKEKLDERIAWKSGNCVETDTREKKLAELKNYVEIVTKQSCLSIKMYEDPDYYFPLDMRNSDNRNWVFALGKEFYEHGDRKKVWDITIEEVQMLETFYDHSFGSDPHYIQKVESREAVRQLLLGGGKLKN